LLLSESGVSDSSTGENTVAKRKVKDEEERLEMQVTRLPREGGNRARSGLGICLVIIVGSRFLAPPPLWGAPGPV
jgi:hypothetical protein